MKTNFIKKLQLSLALAMGVGMSQIHATDVQEARDAEAFRIHAQLNNYDEDTTETILISYWTGYRFPNEVLNFRNLKYLTLYIYYSPDSQNEILVPDEIDRLQNLTHLNLSGKRIKDLPENIGNLVNLTSVSVVATGISKLPDSIGNLTNLRYLVASDCNLEELPLSIVKINRLYSLIIMNREIANHLKNLMDSPLMATFLYGIPHLSTGKVIYNSMFQVVQSDTWNDELNQRVEAFDDATLLESFNTLYPSQAITFRGITAAINTLTPQPIAEAIVPEINPIDMLGAGDPTAGMPEKTRALFSRRFPNPQ